MADTGISVGGLASGLDTNTIVNQLVALEKVSVNRLQIKQDNDNVTLSTWGTLKSNLSTLQSKGASLTDPDQFDKFNISSSNEDILTLDGKDGGSPGTFAIQVFQTAKSEKIMSKTYASQTAALAVSGEFKVNVNADYKKSNPSATDITISVTAADSLKDIANKINSAANIGISASIVKLSDTEFSMVLSSRDTGADGATYTQSVNTVLQDLGVLDGAGTKGNVSQKLQSTAANQSGGADITAATLLTAIDGSGVSLNDTLTIQGTDRNGSAVRIRNFVIGDPAVTVGDLLKEIEASFNGMVTAAVENGRIVVTDKNTGRSNLAVSITANNEGGGALSFGGGLGISTAGKNGVLQAGQDAFFNVDGMYLHSASNTADDVIQGVTVKMKKADLNETVTATLDRDYNGMTKNVQDFLDSFNLVRKFITEQSKVTVKQQDNSDPSTQQQKNTIKRGPLAGDSTVGRLKDELQSILTRQHDELKGATYTTMASVGVTIDGTTGEYKIDTEKFKKALQNDYAGVKKLFVKTGETADAAFQFGASTKDTKDGRYLVDATANTVSELDKNDNIIKVYQGVREANILRVTAAGNAKGLAVTVPDTGGSTVVTFSKGLGGDMADYIKRITDNFNGYVTQRTQSIEKQIKDYDTKISDENGRVARYEAMLKAQYAQLELTMSRLQSQSAQMQAALK